MLQLLYSIQKFMNSKILNFKEQRCLRKGMAMGDIGNGTRGMCSMSSSYFLYCIS